MYIFLQYSVPWVVISWLEWWWIETLSIISGWLSKNELAANVALLNLNYIIYNFPLGMSYAVWAMIGNSLGSNKPLKAVKYVKVSMALSFVFCVLTIVILLLFRSLFATLFTQEPNIVEIMNQLVPVYALIVICDYMQGVQWGIIRGMGYQKFASIIITISYWIVAIPTAYILAFKADLRIQGIWLGLPAGSFIIWSWFTATLILTNWKKLASKLSKTHRE